MNSLSNFYINSARDCYEAQEYEQAIGYYENALRGIKNEEDRNVIKLELGVIYKNVEKYELAIETLKLVINSWTAEEELYLLHSTLGFSYLELWDYNNALRHNNLALKYCESDFQKGDTYLNLAQTVYFLENYQDAKPLFEKAKIHESHLDQNQLFYEHLNS